MKRIVIFAILLLLFLLMGCGLDSVATTTSNIASTDHPTTTTSLTTSYVNPFPEVMYIRHVTVNGAVLASIHASSGRIAYLDDTLYVAYQEGFNPTKFFVTEGVETLEFDTHQSMGYSENFLFQYDREHNVLYSIRDSSIHSHPSVVEDEVDYFPSRSGKLLVIDSDTFLIQNKIRFFTGETLFADGGVLVMPSVGIGKDIRFYTYRSSTTQSHGCTVRSYDAYDGIPEETVVHDEFTCEADYIQRNEQIVIPLMDGNTMAGVATIASDGVVRRMVFAEAVLDYDHLEFDSFVVVNEWLFVFRYEDSLNESHVVAVTIDLSSILVDEMNASMAGKTLYTDGSTRFYQTSASEYRLYQNNVRTWTYTPRSSSFSVVQFLRDGNYGVIVETNVANGEGRLTRIDLNDLSVEAFDKSLFSLSFQVGGYLALMAEGENMLYDIVHNEWKTMPIEGTMKPIGEDGILFYTDDLVTLYDIASENTVVMNRIGVFRRTLQPYAFLVEYLGNYYVIG